jgi:hypothetical protein
MAYVREHGFIPLVRKPGASLPLTGNPDNFIPPEGDDIPVTPQLEFAPDRAYPLAAIMAPIFDEKGRVPFSLVMAGFRMALGGDQVMHAGGQLREACDRISAFISGRVPEPVE